MENQHRLIKTYRELTQEEIDLMNECKILEAQFHKLHRKITERVENQCEQASHSACSKEYDRLSDATPLRWLSISKTNVEQGFMALVRSIAQPSTPKLE